MSKSNPEHDRAQPYFSVFGTKAPLMFIHLSPVRGTGDRLSNSTYMSISVHLTHLASEIRSDLNGLIVIGLSLVLVASILVRRTI